MEQFDIIDLAEFEDMDEVYKQDYPEKYNVMKKFFEENKGDYFLKHRYKGDFVNNQEELVKQPMYKIVFQDTKETIYESYIDIRNLSNEAIKKLGGLVNSGELFNVSPLLSAHAGGDMKKQTGFLFNNDKGQLELHLENEKEPVIIENDSDTLTVIRNKAGKLSSWKVMVE